MHTSKKCTHTGVFELDVDIRYNLMPYIRIIDMHYRMQVTFASYDIHMLAGEQFKFHMAQL